MNALWSGSPSSSSSQHQTTHHHASRSTTNKLLQKITRRLLKNKTSGSSLASFDMHLELRMCRGIATRGQIYLKWKWKVPHKGKSDLAKIDASYNCHWPEGVHIHLRDVRCTIDHETKVLNHAHVLRLTLKHRLEPRQTKAVTLGQVDVDLMALVQGGNNPTTGVSRIFKRYLFNECRFNATVDLVAKCVQRSGDIVFRVPTKISNVVQDLNFVAVSPSGQISSECTVENHLSTSFIRVSSVSDDQYPTLLGRTPPPPAPLVDGTTTTTTTTHERFIDIRLSSSTQLIHAILQEQQSTEEEEEEEEEETLIS